MAWSIFSDGGGDGAALTWAKDLLSADGVPDTPATEQFIYDWEKSEGGGGKFNPLNQGPVPGHPELTTTGSQYGGGAADFASWQSGITGAVDYLNMPNYTAVQAALKRGDAAGARAALIASPWAASHYGNGASFSNASIPGQASALANYTGGGSVQDAAGDPCSLLFGTAKQACENTRTLASGGGSGGGFLASVLKALGVSSLVDAVERLGLIVLGAVIVIVALWKFTDVGNPVKAVAGKVAGK